MQLCAGNLLISLSRPCFYFLWKQIVINSHQEVGNPDGFRQISEVLMKNENVFSLFIKEQETLSVASWECQ
jgi:hypothetical protein